MIVLIRKFALKDFMKISDRHRNQIKEKIITLQEFSKIPNIKKLVNFSPVYRLRVGDYRVLFDIINDDIIEVARIKHRKNSY